MLRPRRESLHSDGITDQKSLQRTSATKSGQSGHGMSDSASCRSRRVCDPRSLTAPKRFTDSFFWVGLEANLLMQRAENDDFSEYALIQPTNSADFVSTAGRLHLYSFAPVR